MRKFFTTVFALALILSTAQWSFARCDQDFTVTTVDDETEVAFCNAPGFNSRIIVKTDLRGFPIVYALTDGNGEILEVSYRPLFNLSNLPQGNYRIYAVFYIGALLDVVGDNIDDAEFARFCFDVSDNFVSITSGNADDHDVFFENGVTETAVCAGDTSTGEIPFFTTSMNPNYTYLITDTNNVILDTANGLYDFSSAPEGICRIWGLSYDGDLIFEIGDDADSDPLSDGCYSLSNNALTVTKGVVEGGMVMTTDSLTDIAVCLGDSLEFDVVTSSMASAPYVFVITDTNNIILGAQENSDFQIDGSIMGTVRIWGLSIAGTLNSDVGDDADSLDVDGCFELSSNFITVSVTDVDGGMVSTTDGETEVALCGNDPLVVENTSSSDAPYVYVITDTNNVIISASLSDTVDLSGVGGGVCRIWGLSFAGTILAMPGDDADSVQLVDGCSSLSENFITVTKEDVDGGTLVTEDSLETYSICLGDSALTIEVSTNSMSGADYIFVITDEENVILGAQDNGTFEIDPDTSGVIRIWGFSYSGTLVAMPGDDADTAQLVDGCGDLSDNFITVIVDDPDGGMVSAEGDTTGMIDVCVSDGEPDTVTVSTTSMSNSDYLFVVTDTNNIILAVNASGVIDFDGAGPGICRIWGLSFSGTINSGIGDDADSLDVDGCFELSSNFIVVNRSEVDGGTLTTQDSIESYSFCIGDTATIEVTTSSTAGSPYVYVLTDTNNIILGVQGDGIFNIEADTAAIIRIWGLSINGTPISGPGDDADSLEVDGCFDLSDNFITISVADPDGGEVSIVGDTVEMVDVCLGSGDATVDVETNSTSSADYIFVVTDTNNVILDVSADGMVNFDSASAGVCRIWGLSFSGTINSGIGDDADSLDVDGCFSLSSNFITVNKVEVDGGTVTANDSLESIALCIGDSAVINLSNTSASDAPYGYVITDTNNVILDGLDEPIIEIDSATAGIFRIWGISVVGEIQSEIGDDADSLEVDGCFDLSDNFITLTIGDPDGGIVIGPDSMDVIGICADDPEGDTLSVTSTASSDFDFLFVLTTETNVILGTAEDASNFPTSNVPAGVYRVWGLSYNGTILSGPGTPADMLEVDGCFDLSDNFITINASTPEGGSLSSPEADTMGCVTICAGDGADDFINVEVDGADTLLNYLYVITDTNNVILGVSDTSAVNLEGAGGGTCRIWGLSYAGTINSGLGDDADSLDVDGCFDLSDNFIKVIRRGVDGGVVMTSDSMGMVNLCVGDSATVTLMNNSTSDAAYAYVITDTGNVILGIQENNVFVIDSMIEGTFRIWGLSTLDTLDIEIGDDADSIDVEGCFALSMNFVEINGANPDGGMVMTSDGLDSVVYCLGSMDSLTIENTSTSNAPYVYVITDTANVILGAQEEGTFTIDADTAVTVRVWGLSVSGAILSDVGDDADSLMVDGCFELSGNFITVSVLDVDGGTLTASDSVNMREYCVGDADSFSISTTSMSGSPYAYVITDTNNVIIGAQEENVFEIDSAEAGILRIWGLSLNGTLNSGPGDDADSLDVDGCFALSSNFITLIVTEVEGGMVTTAGGMTEITVTVGDTISDSIPFVTTSMANADYIYVVTDTSNVILDVSTSGVVDFNNAPAGVCRVWGLSYTGEILLGIGDTVMAPITDGCFDLSDQFVVVDRVEASMVSQDQFDELFGDNKDLNAKVVQNPAVDNLLIRFDDPRLENTGSIQFQIYSMQGRLMGQAQAAAGSKGDLEIDLANYPAGMYIIHIDGGYSTKTLRFVKQ